MDDLKPCLFCGSCDVDVAPTESFWGYAVYCNDCGAGGPTVDGTEGEPAAIEKWNNRMEINAITVEISKLTLKPNDLLVIRFPKEMHLRRIEDLLPHIKKAIPIGITALFFHGNVELTVVRKNDTAFEGEYKNDPSPAQ